ncbi:MAG TPA: ribosome small subunit-dependent GTPase A [Nitriliruptorales bacterium]
MATPIDLDAYEDEYDPDEPGSGRGRRLSQAARERIDAVEDTARVTSTHRGEVEIVREDGVIVPAVYGGSMRGERVVVGDVVRVEYGEDGDHGRIVARLPRRTWLSRADDDGGESRLVVANVDRVLVVAAADKVRAGLRLLDRVLVSASIGGVPVGMIVNKMDLADAGVVDAALAGHAGFLDPVLPVAAKPGTGVEAVRGVLSHGWTVLVGHSGVGKSTLFNALLPGVERRVGEVGRHGGRHTTVRAMAHPIGEGWLVDTPGIRSWGISDVTPDELAAHWPGLGAATCEVDNCTHTGEAGCRAADAIGEARHERYRQVHAGLTGQAEG